MLLRSCQPAFVSIVFLISGCVCIADAQEDGCYSPGSVAGIVIATVVVTILIGGLAGTFVWYLWKLRKASFEEEKGQEEKPILCQPMTDKQILAAKEGSDYAFDNPYFKDEETNHKTPDAAEKGTSRFRLDNGDITSATQQKESNGTNGQLKKNRPFSSLPFHAVFHPSSGKRQQKTTMDDTYLSKHLERITVPLRGHDFTGLGFNICGNMRDGIFVKDVLHRGPASESGKIKAGDKIIGVTVSFGAMVYEDALTILSYASPYDVKLELEKCPSTHLPSSSPKRLGTSTSFRSGGDQRRLFHPLYRSQSIDDLTQIGKDAQLFDGNSPSGVQKDSCTAPPKRSQSVETMKNRMSAAKENHAAAEGGRNSSCNSTIASPLFLENAASTTEDTPRTKKEVRNSRFRIVEQINVTSDAPTSFQPIRDTGLPIRDPMEEEDNNNVEEEVRREANQAEDVALSTTVTAESEGDYCQKPTAPPRKMCTPKRKAPAPPPAVICTKKETSAVVHRADDQPPDATADILPDQALVESHPEFASEPRVDLEIHHPIISSRTEDSSGTEKRKASSLGDLTRLEHGIHKKASTSSAILERAVSLDLQQSMPGENLVKQKKVLKAPTFEDFGEDREMDSNDAEGLKRWDVNGLDDVVELTNGRLNDVESADEVTEGKVATEECFDVTTIEETEPPVQRVKGFPKDADALDDVPYLASATQAVDKDPPTRHTTKITANSVFSPVTISIPVIKPDLTNFEKLPSPPPASTHPTLDPSWRMSSAADDANRFGLDKISVQALYKPIFTSKEVPSQAEEEGVTVTDKFVNANDSLRHCSPPQKASVDNSFMTVSSISTGNSTNVAIKTPNDVAGFAKTLIVPGPSDVENLLSLATETAIAHLESPPKE